MSKRIEEVITCDVCGKQCTPWDDRPMDIVLFPTSLDEHRRAIRNANYITICQHCRSILFEIVRRNAK